MQALLDWTIHWAQTPYGSWALFALAFAESSFFPIPPDVLLIALSLVNTEQAPFFALICSIGSVLGGMFGYGIGYYGGQPLLKRFFKAEKIEMVHKYFEKYEAWAIGIAGFTPIPYKIFTIAAGVFFINFLRFVIASVLSRSARFFLVAITIWKFWPMIVKHIPKEKFPLYINVFSIVFFVLLIAGFLVVRRFTKKASNFTTNPESHKNEQ